MTKKDDYVVDDLVMRRVHKKSGIRVIWVTRNQTQKWVEHKLERGFSQIFALLFVQIR